MPIGIAKVILSDYFIFRLGKLQCLNLVKIQTFTKNA